MARRWQVYARTTLVKPFDDLFLFNTDCRRWNNSTRALAEYARIFHFNSDSPDQKPNLGWSGKGNPMQHSSLLVAILILATSQFSNAADDATPTNRSNEKGKPDVVNPIPNVNGASAQDDKLHAQRGVAMSSDERQVRDTAASYVKAFNDGDASRAAAHFTESGEYIDEHDNRFKGRQAIENLLKSFFAENRRCKLELHVDSVRELNSDLAIEEGTSKCVHPDGSMPHSCAYSAVHVKSGGKWLTASVRDRQLEQPRDHASKLKQFDWLVGDWIHEGDDSVVRFSCHPVDNSSFLVRKFTVTTGGKQTMSGSQRIGWDAQAGKFRAWVFDSDGGHAEGFWHRDGAAWVLKLSGVTADGKPASATTVYSNIDARTITYQSVNHEVAGEELPDSSPVRIVRELSQPDCETTKR